MTTGFSTTDAATIRDRSGGRCEICGGGNPTQIHHRKPRRSGGTAGQRGEQVNAVPNGLRVCQWCHDRAESRRAEALHMGWIVAEADDPAEVPVYLNVWAGQGWYRLLPWGGYDYAEAPA